MTDTRRSPLAHARGNTLENLAVNIQENFEDDVVKEELKKGTDLREYSRQIESRLSAVEQASIMDYIQESENIAKLHTQIVTCDGVLERMEAMLQTFQLNLGNISTEIQSLQEQSVTMNVKLKNRQAVRGELSEFIDEMVVPEALINNVLDAPVTEREFVESLQELDHKINFVKEQSFKDARSVHDVENVLAKLKYKAVSKIREFCLQKIQQFKKPMTNYQIPQNGLLKFKFFFEFLMAHERQVAREIRDEYVDTMGKMYFSYFKAYMSKLMRLQVDKVADKDDLLAADDGARRGFFSKATLTAAGKSKASTFTLGTRGSVLTTDLEAAVIVPHAAAKTEVKYTYESLFRSIQYALLDNACREYIFLSSFFMVTNAAAQEMFNAIMGRSLGLILKEVEAYVKESYDCLALLLCAQLVFRYQILVHERTVSALDKYWEALLEILWPRFEAVMALHCSSVRDCNVRRLSADGHLDLQPHYISRKCSEFAAAVISLNDKFPEERAGRQLTQLLADVQNFLLCMAAEFPDRKDQLVFLINNYDLVITVVLEHMSGSECHEMDSFKALLAARTDDYINEVLFSHFGDVVTFVKDAEQRLDQGGAAALEAFRGYEKKVTQLVKGFNSDWKKSVDTIDANVMRSFANLKNGAQILQAALTQLIQLYHRFQKVMSQPPFKNWSIKNELINIHNIMVEVKKHKLTF